MPHKFSTYNIAIATILLLIVVIGLLILFMNPSKKRTRKLVNTTIVEKPEKPNPVFRKDGELRFLNGKTNEVITAIDIEVADDDAEREQGLMYRDSMAENSGMLFLMETEELQAFWMKNTILPLDIMFVDSERRIVSIHRNCRPYSLDQIPSGKPAIFVVEVNAGYTEKHGIMVGDLISF
jgi:uncharacterized membrane protein (UPF0127 family)